TLTAVDSVLIPVTPAYLPTKGLEQLIVTIGKVKKFLNPKIQIEGVLFTMVDARTNFSKEIMQMLRVTYGENIRFFTEEIPKSVRAEEASAEGISIYKHDYSGKVAKAYESLVKEVMIDEQCR
ncbi:MAG: ParA family protein, partial [Eubacterium sp.]|nr:ParA family protein [Eubacterium sp.]